MTIFPSPLLGKNNAIFSHKKSYTREEERLQILLLWKHATTRFGGVRGVKKSTPLFSRLVSSFSFFLSLSLLLLEERAREEMKFFVPAGSHCGRGAFY